MPRYLVIVEVVIMISLICIVNIKVVVFGGKKLMNMIYLVLSCVDLSVS